ncbi:MAG: DNA-binding protein [Xenococcus sp. (in: cyanobacteria)]
MDRIVGTTEAAFLLDISVSRVKVLLQQKRIKGAKKEGRVWKIPLTKGIPQVKECDRGLKGTWRRKRCNKTTKIHVNKPKIDQNRKHKTLEPVITIRQGSRKTSCHIADIKGSCRVVYQPDNPLSCGAVVWIEVLPDTVVIPQLLTKPSPLRFGSKDIQ